MAMQKKNQYLGHVGEVEVLRELLDIGASINSLSTSDFGWDLHVHLPENAMVIGDVTAQSDGLQQLTLKDLDAWDMSGYTANIQVKKQTSRSTPTVTVSTLRGWLTGSRVGVPTFVIIVKAGLLTYLSPYSLLSILREADDQSYSDTKKVALKGGVGVSVIQLSRLLHIWTRHPQIMLAGGFDDVLTYEPRKRKERARVQAVSLASSLALAWLRDHDKSSVDDQTTLSETYTHFGSIAKEKLNLGAEDDCEEPQGFCFEIGQEVVANRSTRYGYTDNEYVKIYTRSVEARESKDDAGKIIEEICILMRELSN